MDDYTEEEHQHFLTVIHKQYEDKLKEQIDFINKSLTEQEKNVLNWYDSYKYTLFNEEARSEIIIIPENLKMFELLSNIFDRIPPITHTIELYRGICAERVFNHKYSFISTSININVAKTYAIDKDRCPIKNVKILILNISPGSKVLPLFSRKGQANAFNFEVLLDYKNKLQETYIKYENGLNYIYITYLPDLSVEFKQRNHELLDKQIKTQRIIDFFKTKTLLFENYSKQDIENVYHQVFANFQMSDFETVLNIIQKNNDKITKHRLNQIVEDLVEQRIQDFSDNKIKDVYFEIMKTQINQIHMDYIKKAIPLYLEEQLR